MEEQRDNCHTVMCEDHGQAGRQNREPGHLLTCQ